MVGLLCLLLAALLRCIRVFALRPINVAVTWTFGYMGYNFVPVIDA
jgi:hypothetical protein